MSRRRVLIPLDIHDHLAASSTALRMAREWIVGHDLIADLVWVDRYYEASVLVRYAALEAQIRAEHERVRQHDLEALQSLLATLPERNQGEARVIDGRPDEKLPELGNTYDLMMIAALPHRGHLSLGSAGERTLRLTKTPTVVLRPNQGTGDAVVAVDLGDEAGQVVQAAVAWLAPLGITLHLLHVCPPLLQALPLADGVPLLETLQPADAELAGRKATLERLSRAIPEGQRGSVRVVCGDPAQAVLDAVEGASWVVMGTHGRTGLRRLWLGSVAERVVRLSEASALVVHTLAVD